MNPQNEAKSDEIAPMSIVDDADKPPSLKDRLFAAILAPIAFNFSIVIMVALISSPTRLILFNPYQLFYQVSANFTFLITIVLPSIAGLMMGMSRFTTLFGHFFYTNSGDDQHIGKTIFAWAGLFLTAYVISRFLT